jgi:hypothetical protein
MRALKRFFLLLAWAVAVATGVHAKESSSGAVSVRGYTRADGTYVAPHMRSAPNGTAADNWRTKGNVNPYTGAAGTKVPTAGTENSAAVAPSAASKIASSSTSEVGPVAEAANPVVTPIHSDRELLLLVLTKLTYLETKVSELEKKTRVEAAAYQKSVQSAFDLVGKELSALKYEPRHTSAIKKDETELAISPPISLDTGQ